MAEVTASCFATHILGSFQKNGDHITNLKLQKLLYYSQAWYLANYDKPLFDDRIEAWVHGPVVPAVFQAYKFNRWSPISIDYPACTEGQSLPKHLWDHLDNILSTYGKLPGWDLERLSHRELPWLEARAGIAPDASSNAQISHASMKAFFRRNG